MPKTLNLSVSAILFFALFAAVATFSRILTPYMFLATVAYLLMVSGFLIRKQSKLWHTRLMLAAIGLDLALVLTLELSRSVIGITFGPTLNNLQRAHVAFSTSATVLYIPMLILGYGLWKAPNQNKRGLHAKLGMITFFMRTMGFLLMFSMIGRSA